MPSFLNRMAQAGGAATDPVSQAIGVYTSLHNMKRQDEEAELRKRQDERAQEAHDLSMRQTRQAIDFNTEKIGRQRKEWQQQDDTQALRDDLAILDAGGQLTPDQLTRVFGAKSMIDLDRQEPLQNIMQAHESLGQFFSELPRNEFRSPVEINRDPANEKVFQSLERLSASRNGAVHAYKVLDPETGKVIEAQGTVDRIAQMYYDPTSDTVSVGMTVVDAKTGKPLLDPKTGKQMIVPATDGRTSDDKDTVKAIPRSLLVENSKLGIERNQRALQQLSQQDPITQRRVVLSQLAAKGDQRAVQELANLRQVESYVDAAQTALLDPNLDPEARQEFESIVRIGYSGVATVEQLKTLNDLAMAKARKDTATKETIAAEDRKQEHAIELEDVKGKWRVKEEKVKQTAADDKESRERKKLVEASYRAAQSQLGLAIRAAKRNLVTMERDPMSPMSRAIRSAKTEEERRAIREAYVADDEGVRSATDALTVAKARMETEGLIEKPRGPSGVDLSQFLVGPEPAAPAAQPAAPAAAPAQAPVQPPAPQPAVPAAGPWQNPMSRRAIIGR